MSLVVTLGTIAVLVLLLLLEGPKMRRAVLDLNPAYRGADEAASPHETGPGPAQPDLATGTGTSGMVPVRIERHPLAATAGLVWSGDLPRQLQQVLFDTAVGITF